MRRWLGTTMTILTVAAAGILWTVPVSTDPLQAAPPSAAVPAGSGLYSTYCVVCHGTDAKGTGPLAASLKTTPADLTRLAKDNNGIFPADRVFKVIDGRTQVKGHGGGDMPVWGEALLKSQDGGSPEAVKSRIDALVTYLQVLQK